MQRRIVTIEGNGKMFNCCTIASCSLPPESAGVEQKACFNGIAAKDSACLLPEKGKSLRASKTLDAVTAFFFNRLFFKWEMSQLDMV